MWTTRSVAASFSRRVRDTVMEQNARNTYASQQMPGILRSDDSAGSRPDGACSSGGERRRMAYRRNQLTTGTVLMLDPWTKEYLARLGPCLSYPSSSDPLDGFGRYFTGIAVSSQTFGQLSIRHRL